MTSTTMNRKRKQSALKRYWKILFAIIGLLDCCCYCYCHYYYHSLYDDDAKYCPKDHSCRDHHPHRRRHHSRRRKVKVEDHKSYTSKRALSQHASPSSTPPFLKNNQMLFSFLWQSMAFSYHPGSSSSSSSGFSLNRITKDKGSFRDEHKYKTTNGKAWRESFEGTTAHDILQLFLIIHLGFGILCLIEMAVRAAEARQIVVENQAIAALEDRIAETVAKVYRRRNLLQRHPTGLSFYSLRKAAEAIPSSLNATRTFKLNHYIPSLSSISGDSRPNESTNVHSCGRIIEKDDQHENVQTSNDEDVHDDGDDDETINKRNILLFLRATIRLWIPVGVTCFFWLTLLPLEEYYRIVKIFLFDLEDCDTSGGGQADGRFDCLDVGDDDWQESTVCYDYQHQLCFGSSSSSHSTETARLYYLEILGDDVSWATLWITTVLFRWTETFSSMQDYLVKAVWKKYLLAGGKGLQQRPKLVWKRIGRFLNFIKLIRFAGPLTRMILKLNDQLLVGYSTFLKDRSSKSYRAQKLRQPSLLMRDLKRIESFHKIETTIASWPSHCSMLLETLTQEVKAPFCRVSSSAAKFYAQEFLDQSRHRGRQITRQIRLLQEQLRRGLTEFSSSEVYDNILKLSKDISRKHLDYLSDHDDDNFEDDHDENNSNDNNEKTNYSNSIKKEPKGSPRHLQRRHHSSNMSSWYDYLHLRSSLNARDFLISPRSRFSVMWRITVTNCLLLELTRLSVSWHLTKTFHLSITQVISRLFVDCSATPEDTKFLVRWVTDRLDEWHAALSHAIPLVPFPKDKLVILCVPTSQSAKLFLLAGSLIEIFIDVVSFCDIFFWFFTGDLDGETGLVVPKAFFGRCILPGTLVQVLDHPTLPEVLPSILGRLANLAMTIGWSRLIRWLCAVVPALKLVVVRPLSAYFFRHFEESNNSDRDNAGGVKDDLLMSYAESFGYLPQRQSSLLVVPSTKHDGQWTEDSTDESCDGDQFRDFNRGPNPSDDDSDDFPTEGVAVSVATHYLRSTPPGSPARSALRRAHISSPYLAHDHDHHHHHHHHSSPDSSVRFAMDSSVYAKDNGSAWESNHSQFDGSSVYDIGLSLSSHALYDLHQDGD
mmetsp:Transcript_13152/g.36988  ORF Transcript_13152/g.36988 Transcript_13152/m.36988 type:complete len:1105 (-) Transcript_13152:634-3948(-)